MARAPETAFYFEPISERLALVVEGSPFPSDDHWAWLGDPISVTPEQAQLLVAVRWPGVDPSTLEVEFDLNFERAVKAKEEDDARSKAGLSRVPLEFDLDIDQLLAQAEELRAQVRQVSLDAPSQMADEAAAEAERLRELIARAKELTDPSVPGRLIEVAAAPEQSTRLVRGDESRAPAPGAAPLDSAPAVQPARPAEKTAATPVEADAPALIPEIVPDEPRERRRVRIEPGLEPSEPGKPARPRLAKPATPPEPKPEPEPKPAPRRPNIRDKR